MAFLDSITSYSEALHSGIFCEGARTAVIRSGLDLALSAKVANMPISGRTKQCTKKMKVASTNKWVLSVAEHGYKVQWKGDKPRTPYQTGNPPTK